MAALYPGTSVSGYNANPPPDDGTQGSNNLITWNNTIKAKLSDPLNTFAGAVDSNITAAFGKTLDGAAIVSTGISYQVVAADQGKLIKATAAGITITAPVPGVGAPFVFGVNNQSAGTITLAGSSANIDGSSTQVIQPGGGCILHFDGTNWFSFGLQPAQITTSGSQHGFNAPINMGLAASVGSNILTVAVKTVAGNDPSAGDPVLIPFRDPTIANGGPVWLTVTAALNITTNAVGATLGTANTVPFRIWVVCFNNGGGPVLALYQTVTGGASPTAISPLNPGNIASTTGISAAATSAGIFYSPNGVTVSNKAFTILGYVDYGSGLATAGTYASTPTTIELFGPGIRKPCDVVQKVYASTTSSGTTTSATFVDFTSAITAVMAPTASPNLVRTLAYGTGSNSGSNGGNIQINRNGTTPIGIIAKLNDTAITGQLYASALDAPGSTSSATYHIFGKIGGGGTFTFPVASTGAVLELEEIMV